MKFIAAILLLINILFPIAGFAVDDVLLSNPTDRLAEKSRQLVDVKKSMIVAREDLVAINQKIEQTAEDSERKILLAKKEQLVSRLQSLIFTFEEIATGGVKITDYTKVEETKKFDWQQELIDIFKPMIAELKALTEKARAIEKLRSEKVSIEENLPVAKTALKKIQELKKSVVDEATLDELTAIENDWQKRTTDLTNQLQLVSFQLEEKLNPPDAGKETVYDKIISFMSGQGLTLLLAIGAFLTCFLIFSAMGQVLERQITRSPNRQKLFFQRALRIGLRLFSILVSLMATILVLYIRGDWLILGFILIILIGFAWALRQSLPGYVREAKLMLNMGPVREGERVNYNGIPWQVRDLNFYTELANPLLSGGSIKLPVSVIVDLNSRKHADNEAWFPCETDDYVILEDECFGRVILQTPDIVQIKLIDGSIKTYATTDFLAQNQRNLSAGFGVRVTFGLDYNLQPLITHEIPNEIETRLKDAIRKETYASYLLKLRVVFKEAATSSLDILIKAEYKGEAAADYYEIERNLQREIVNLCTEKNWNIPFNNLTVNLNKS